MTAASVEKGYPAQEAFYPTLPSLTQRGIEGTINEYSLFIAVLKETTPTFKASDLTPTIAEGRSNINHLPLAGLGASCVSGLCAVCLFPLSSFD